MSSKRRSHVQPQAPSGTVTFLFTDIQGSTHLWETQHEAMRMALARHDDLVRRNIEAHRGFVFKTVGDAFCAAFPTAPDAIAAALDAQRSLYREAWPEFAPIRVRMAVHAGATEFRDGDYFGSPLNVAARLLAVGHGGQTVVSEIANDLCVDRLPAGAALQSLGEHALKDVARRQTVFQLCHPDLPRAFPPLRTLPGLVGETVPSIAVLPFVNMSQDEENEYFADGLAEELISVLSKIPRLRVVSRTSAFHFKGKDIDIPTVAQKLNVATVLEGSVRKSGNRVRIVSQLIEVATDSHLWSETYDRELEDIFAVQDDIAQSVVKELRALLQERPDAAARAAAQVEVRAAAKGRGDNAEAYRLYLQGRFFEDRATREGVEKALEYYSRAVETAPTYALAWSGLARACTAQGGYAWDAVDASFNRAREAAERALELEPDLAEAHRALAQVRILHDWDWKGAEISLRRALELAPGDAEVMRTMALLAGGFGRLDEAIDLLRRAAAHDPLSVPVHRALAVACWCAGRSHDAESAAGKAIELNPQGGIVRASLGLMRLQQGRLSEAQEMFERESHESFRLVGFALLHYARGDRAKSDTTLRELIEKGAADSAVQIAMVYAARGESDEAFQWLERAYAQRDSGLWMSRVAPMLRNLTNDPRWRPFLERLGLTH